MSENPNQIAADLVKQYGLDGALETVRREIVAVHVESDNYRLSIWRDVKRALQDNPVPFANTRTA